MVRESLGVGDGADQEVLLLEKRRESEGRRVVGRKGAVT